MAQQCVGDCDGDGTVAINELITAVLIGLEGATVDRCPAFDCDCGPLPPGICCAIQSVRNALEGCPTIAGPTPTPTLDPVQSCGLQENVGGCCDFFGQKPCYQLGQFGDSAAICAHTDGGFPRGCHGSVVCNASTGLCEDATPLPTPAGPE